MPPSFDLAFVKHWAIKAVGFFLAGKVSFRCNCTTLILSLTPTINWSFYSADSSGFSQSMGAKKRIRAVTITRLQKEKGPEILEVLQSWVSSSFSTGRKLISVLRLTKAVFIKSNVPNCMEKRSGGGLYLWRALPLSLHVSLTYYSFKQNLSVFSCHRAQEFPAQFPHPRWAAALRSHENALLCLSLLC